MLTSASRASTAHMPSTKNRVSLRASFMLRAVLMIHGTGKRWSRASHPTSQARELTGPGRGRFDSRSELGVRLPLSQVPDQAAKILDVEGLVEDRRSAEEPGVDVRAVVAERGDQDHRDAVLRVVQLAQDLESRELRHAQVGDDHVYRQSRHA